MVSKVRKFLSKDQTVRIATVDSTNLVKESIKHHKMSMLAACLSESTNWSSSACESTKRKAEGWTLFQGQRTVGYGFR